MIFLYCTRLPVMVRKIGIELKKEKADQFENIISPVLFIILVLIVPFASIKELFPPEVPLKFAGRAAYISIASLCFLLPTAVVQAKQTRGTLSKQNFNEAFFKQCYIQAPILFLLINVVLLTNFAHSRGYTGIIINGRTYDLLHFAASIIFIVYCVIETRFIFPNSEPDGKSSTKLRRFLRVLVVILFSLFLFLMFSERMIGLMSE